MFSIDKHFNLHITYEFGEKIDLKKATFGLWNVCLVSKAQGRRESLVVRDPRFPVAIVHQKGTIRVSGAHKITFAFQSLKALAAKLAHAKDKQELPMAEKKQASVRCTYLSGHYRISPSTVLVEKSTGEAKLSFAHANLTTGGVVIPEAGWNMRSVDIFLSKNYEWCLSHGVEDIFCTKKATKRYELEIRIDQKKAPGAAKIALRMNEQGGFHFTVSLINNEIAVDPSAGATEEELVALHRLQSEINAVKDHLQFFMEALHRDVLIHCQKHKFDLSSLQ